jgi:Tol biopolymer transport system component
VGTPPLSGCCIGVHLHPSWSPDGGRIAFAAAGAGRNAPSSIDVIAAGGTGLTTLLAGTATTAYSAPAWSPSGAKIALVATNPTTRASQIGVMSADGTGLQLLAAPAGQSDALPDWSPDSMKLVFTRFATTSPTPEGTIFEANADLSGVTQLPNPGNEIWAHPVWSPDGTRIAARSTLISGDIWTMSAADGSGLVQVTHLDGTNEPGWQPVPAATAPPAITSRRRPRSRSVRWARSRSPRPERRRRP